MKSHNPAVIGNLLAFPTSDMVDYIPKMARKVLVVLQHLLEVTVFQLAI